MYRTRVRSGARRPCCQQDVARRDSSRVQRPRMFRFSPAVLGQRVRAGPQAAHTPVAVISRTVAPHKAPAAPQRVGATLQPAIAECPVPIPLSCVRTDPMFTLFNALHLHGALPTDVIGIVASVKIGRCWPRTPDEKRLQPHPSQKYDIIIQPEVNQQWIIYDRSRVKHTE